MMQDRLGIAGHPSDRTYVPDWNMIGTDPDVITATTGEGEAAVLIAIDREEMFTGCHIRRRRR